MEKTKKDEATEVTPSASKGKVSKSKVKKEIKDLVPLESDPMAISPDNMRSRMSLETERRKVLTDYISANLVPGKDYGTISFTTRAGKTVESKPTLFKPGAEKFCSLFALQARFRKDTDTWEMMGSKPGTIAYICELITKAGDIVGEGRGVSEITEKAGWTFNNAVKIAEKRAQIDAVLRSGGLSDFFTQDLEDQPDAVIPTQQQSAADPRKVSRAQLNFIFKILGDKGIPKEDIEAKILKSWDVIGIENLSVAQAMKILDALIKKYPEYGSTQKPQNSVNQAVQQEDLPTIQYDQPTGSLDDDIKVEDIPKFDEKGNPLP